MKLANRKTLFASAACPAGPFASKPVPDNARVTRLDNALPNDNYQTQFGNVEGAVWPNGCAQHRSSEGPCATRSKPRT